MKVLLVLGVFVLGAALGTLLTRMARRSGMDVRKNWGKLA